MKIFWFILSATCTIALIYFLNIPLPLSNGVKTPCLGLFLSPQKGFWANAESTHQSFDQNIKLKGLQANADVYFDERLVPHIYANTDADAYYLQGYLHAKFRLWQMEFQTHIAAGRLSEIRGKDSTALAVDKFFRRLGMVYAAENCVHEMEKDVATKKCLDAYTNGINAYIDNMKSGEMPFEYKLLDYKPEHWSNLKTALFLKLMCFDLAGGDNDIASTNALSFLGNENYTKLFVNVQDSLDPIISKGTKFNAPSIKVITPANVDSVYLMKQKAMAVSSLINPDVSNGSNNWAVDSSKTKSKKPILCNDPHLGLSLPSLWYEMQISTPEYSSYGVSFPGAPAIIIGFNNNIAWGVTNSGRDVKDYYELQFKDATMQEYKFDNKWKKATVRNEIIKVKGQKDIVERLAVTDFGVVMYDKTYLSKNKDGKCLAVRWTAHDPSNELQTFMKLNKAKNYTDYKNAINTFQCPGQNFVFASKAGDVAITQQGKFVAKWQQQGDFVMPGMDSSYMWQGYVPVNENPAQHNPARGFVSSANQKAVDETYPYYLGKASNFPIYRGLIINRKLSGMQNISVADMKEMQTDNYDVVAEMLRPMFLKYINESKLNNDEKRYVEILKDWNLNDAFDEKAATIMYNMYYKVDALLFKDEFAKCKTELPARLVSALIDNLKHDSTHFSFINNSNTTEQESLETIINTAFANTVAELLPLEKQGKLQWGKYRQTSIMHPLKLDALSRKNITTSGSVNCINATKEYHGPSWRMIVHLTDEVEAYGVFPGGQSGNVGSKYYDNFIDTWVAGKYYNLQFVLPQQAKEYKNFKWHMSVNKV